MQQDMTILKAQLNKENIAPSSDNGKAVLRNSKREPEKERKGRLTTFGKVETSESFFREGEQFFE